MPITPLGLPSVTPHIAERPRASELIDRYGRVAKDLRVSVTDRCNLRCTYCMPEEGPGWLPGGQLLSTDELARLLTIAVRDLGITEIRFTGGEPLLRPDLPDLIATAASLLPRPELSITTNGIGLAEKAHALAVAGLDRVNVSLDTIDRETFRVISRRDRLADVLRGLESAKHAGLKPVKVNALLQRGINDAHAADLLEFCLNHGYELRIIEHMPLDAGHLWRSDEMVTANEILASLAERFSLTPDPQLRGAAPAQRWLVDGGPATVGIIASVTKPFCGDCDRVRLTADGQVRNCLFASDETDLRSLLRGSADDEEIADQWRMAIWNKKPGHGINDPDFLQPSRPMSAIGG
ncbi:GTP 3',8-cyclase MoaA [Hoyosella rhizosphaerae]|uniref:GTP 3',8-cyclase n=1 Tax=Hoyosella rhizosphaerae TaxID=1755582 RepID=A0A916X8E1_9ACTN|nr:GTP 3',8-cyclase MoaA [Hoyosella rhizosphaerae]MBN4927044.1 GTP 3',8-cyclase MoaA [Hoyosella rhizosphaerae]GGC54492.1 cyclic pyranopterin monophosphate synthase [Hoyosella rhizosphaerae]